MVASPAIQQSVNDLWQASKTLRRKAAFFALMIFKRMSDLAEERSPSGALPFAGNEHLWPPGRPQRFVVAANCSWSDVRNQRGNLGLRLNSALRALEDANPPATNLFSRLDFCDPESFPEGDLQQFFALLDLIPLRDSDMGEQDFLAVLDELLLRFTDEAPDDERLATTPRQLARLVVEILQPQEGMSVYDCACGSGGMLLECRQLLRRMKKNARSLRLYGQDIDPECCLLARMMMAAHGIDDAAIEEGDSLGNPRHLTGDGKALMTFDRVVSHPPLGLKEWGFDEWERGDPYGRTAYGIPPKSCADLAFLEHAIASLNGRGMLATVVPEGILFRSREEGNIGRRILQDDLVEAVINLAPEVLPSSPIRPCILVLNKAKPKERRGRILLVDEAHQESDGRSRGGLSDEAADRIASAFIGFEDEEHFCRVVPLEEVEQNGFTLGVSRSARPQTETAEAHALREWQVLLKLIGERNEAEKKLMDQMRRLDATDATSNDA